MAVPGPTTQRNMERLAGNLLRLARAERGWSQAQLAGAAGVPASTVGRIEAGRRQPSLVTLYRLLAAADVELRVRLEPYDDHDDVLDARDAGRSPQQRAAAEERHDANVGAFRDAAVWTDVASGARDDRPELAWPLEQLLPGDTLVVWRLDRLGRSLRHLIDVVTALDQRGVGFRSVQESIDTTTAGGRLVFHLFAALAEFDRDLIRDRTLAGLEAARARGRHGGRPPKMTPAKLRQAARMQADGTSVAEIADVLGVGRATVYRHLTGQPGQSG